MRDSERNQGVKVPWILSGVNESRISEFWKMSKLIAYKKGEIIIHEGEPAFGLYIIQQGLVKLTKRNPLGQKMILKLLAPGEVLGEKTLFSQGCYRASAQALKKTNVYFMEKKCLLNFMEAHISIAFNFIEKLARELKGFQTKLVEISYKKSESRLGRLLLSIAERYGSEENEGLNIGIKLTRSEIAEMCGISLETASRQLASMEKKGLITLKNHEIYIRNKAGLAKITEPMLVELKENVV